MNLTSVLLFKKRTKYQNWNIAFRHVNRCAEFNTLLASMIV